MKTKVNTKIDKTPRELCKNIALILTHKNANCIAMFILSISQVLCCRHYISSG